jgi:methylated-DNA-[protein]-cysteine S-methyltransferase
MNLYYGEIKTPIGTMLAVSDGEGLVRIDYGDFSQNEESLIKWTKRFLNNVQLIYAEEKVSHVNKQLNEYFHKERVEFDFEYSFYGTDFQKNVWQVLVDELPFGKVKSYKEIAIAIGNPRAVRAVGGAVNKNPFSIVVPCHRVMGADGKLVGYNGGLDKKEYLLKHEEILL